MAEEPTKYTFQFQGQASTGNLDAEEEVVFGLEEHARDIERDIEAEVHRLAPGGMVVYATISFRRGSIFWEGTITVISWMGMIAGVAAFLRLMADVIRLAVDRAIRSRLPQFRGRAPVRFQGTYVEMWGPFETAGPSSTELLRMLTYTSAGNAALLLLLVVLMALDFSGVF